MDKVNVFCYNLIILTVRKRVAPETRWKDRAMDKGSPPKVLLYIEDDPANRVLVKRIMEAQGYRVLEAETGAEGLEIAQAELPGVILVDINMPGMDGFEVVAQLKELPRTASVPVIAVTAMVMKGDRERTLEAGCADYIEKPIDVDRLPEQVAAVLR